ncbi:hypothetical protein ES703_120921 [subsurface metagenome]
MSVWGLKHQMRRMGLCPKCAERKSWTPEEEERLAELLGKCCLEKAAYQMHRTVASLASKAKRLGLTLRGKDGWFTAREVAEILGVPNAWVRRRIESGALKASYHYGIKPGSPFSWHIQKEDLRAFIRHYPEELGGRVVDFIQVVDILVGLE